MPNVEADAVPEGRVLAKYPSFLREVQNFKITWEFTLSSGMKVRGKLVDFLWDDKGTPITLNVLKDRATMPVEIPWVAINTIKYIGGER